MPSGLGCSILRKFDTCWCFEMKWGLCETPENFANSLGSNLMTMVQLQPSSYQFLGLTNVKSQVKQSMIKQVFLYFSQVMCLNTIL